MVLILCLFVKNHTYNVGTSDVDKISLFAEKDKKESKLPFYRYLVYTGEISTSLPMPMIRSVNYHTQAKTAVNHAS